MFYTNQMIVFMVCSIAWKCSKQQFLIKLNFSENFKREIISRNSKFQNSKLLSKEHFEYDIHFDNISCDTIWYSDRLGELFIQRLILSVSEPPKISTGGNSGVTLTDGVTELNQIITPKLINVNLSHQLHQKVII